MSRSLSSTATTSINKQETPEVWLVLLTISHTDLAVPIRVVANNENVTSNDNLFVDFPFEIALPGDYADRIPDVRLRIDNVDRQIVDSVRAISSPASVTLEVVLASSPDTVEISIPDMLLRDVEYDALIVEGTLEFEDVLNEPFPADTFNPSTNPGLF